MSVSSGSGGCAGAISSYNADVGADAGSNVVEDVAYEMV